MEIPEKYYMAGKHPTAQNVGQLKKLLDELPDSLRITDNWDQAPMAEIEARIKAHTQPDGEVFEMALCEAGRLMLRPNVLYRFTVRDGCKACADAAEPYSQNVPDQPRE